MPLVSIQEVHTRHNRRAVDRYTKRYH